MRKLRKIYPRASVIVIIGMVEAEEEYEGLQIHFPAKAVCPLKCLIREAQTALCPGSTHLICHPERREALAERVEGPLACW